jgi:hypothetical protein
MPIIKPVIPALPVVSVGCDPEFFLKVDDKIVSAIPLFEGSKNDPRPLIEQFSNKELGTVIHDNVAVEFTMPPCTDKITFGERIRAIRAAIIESAKTKLPAGVNVALDFGGSAVFPIKHLADPEAIKFGCDPDFSAWKWGEENPAPDISKVGNLRATGGHIHVGFLPGASERVQDMLTDEFGKIVFTQLMDMSVGQVVANMERGNGNLVTRLIRRRTMYGAAGAFRPKPYGVEYRSPSSVWCRSSIECERVFTTVQVLCSLIDRHPQPHNLVNDFFKEFNLTQEDVINSINRSRPIPKLLNFFASAEQER